MKSKFLFLVLFGGLCGSGGFGQDSQQPQVEPRKELPPAGEGEFPREGGPGGGRRFGGPDGPGGPGMGMGPMRQETKLLAKFDADGNKMLDAAERKAAREFLAKERAEGRGPRGPGMRPPGGPGEGREGGGGRVGPMLFRRPDGPGGPGEGGGAGRPFPPPMSQEPAKPGPKIAQSDVSPAPASPLYDTGVLRTLFLEFEDADWEKELAEFHDTDVEVPATLRVDGKKYEKVGVHFRGMSSFMMIGEGHKRSLNLTLDFVKEKQDLRGYRTLNLLNSNGDPTMMRGALYSEIASHYLPVPRVNFMRVVINGEYWGVYVNAQQFNKDFVEEHWGSKKGARWKAPGSPGGRAGLEYLGDDVAKYKERFQIKSKDDPASWTALIELCRVLNQTPSEQLVEKLSPILDIEGALRFLALENVFINEDGYWTRASDFSLYRDERGVFHIVPHDMNETFSELGGPGMDRLKASGMALDPLVAAEDARKPLLSKLLAVPALRERYVALVREIASTWLDWNKIGPLVEQYRATIGEAVKADTRKLASTAAFEQGIDGEPVRPAVPDVKEEAAGPGPGRVGRRGPPQAPSLKTFVTERRAYLLEHLEPKPEKAASTTGG